MREELAQATSPPQPVRDLPRRPPQARAARGQDRRRGHLASPPAARVADALAWFSTPRGQARPASSSEIARAILKEINERLGFLNNVGLDYLNLDRTSRHALGRREPAHPPRQPDRLAASRACSTSSTSPRSASTSATTTACSKRSSACAISATPCSSSSMTRTRSATPTMSSTWAPAPASTAARSSRQGTLDEVLANENSLTADYLTGRRAIAVPRQAPQGQRQEAHRPRRPRQQPQGRHRLDPARHLHLHHRRLGLGQVELHHRHALRRAPRARSTAPASSPARTTRSPASNISTR